MNEEQKKPEEKIEEKEKHCPFGSLACQSCRLFRPGATQGQGCIFQAMLWALQGIDMFGGIKGD